MTAPARVEQKTQGASHRINRWGALSALHGANKREDLSVCRDVKSWRRGCSRRLFWRRRSGAVDLLLQELSDQGV